jgi:hypothetical protein
VLLDAIMGKAAPPAPDGRWRFELGPPGCWERVHHTVAARMSLRLARELARLPTPHDICSPLWISGPRWRVAHNICLSLYRNAQVVMSLMPARPIQLASAHSGGIDGTALGFRRV